MFSSLVIKVKYGESIKRFTIYVDENGYLNLTLDGLRARILNHFNISSEVEITLKYLDEDGDLITLANEDDLSDAISIGLHPIRITLQLNNQNDAANSERLSSRNSYISRSDESRKLNSGNKMKSEKEESAVGFSFRKNDPRNMDRQRLPPDYVLRAAARSLTTYWDNRREQMKAGIVVAPSTNAQKFRLRRKTIHRGIECDNCGVYPITGPRFQSRIKIDYDLCYACFMSKGSNEYFRVNHPGAAPMSLFHYVFPRNRIRLDSMILKDRIVMAAAGNKVKPGAFFTMIWRIFNSGTIYWPSGMQLVWIGGYKFFDKFPLQMNPPHGVYAQHEIDIFVNFKAPEQPGGYISYMVLSLASGYKFGEVIKVEIQVVNETDESKTNNNANVESINEINQDNSTKTSSSNMEDSSNDFSRRFPFSEEDLEKVLDALKKMDLSKPSSFKLKQS